MIGIALATAAAGIVVGTVSVTGLGLVMTEFVETVSAGNIIAMLLLVAFICLLLGMGMPTTASYIVVSTLMAPVVVELGAQSGLVVPLVAVHMFVFYFGLMADVTPPVGLASFAAAAISRADPIKTGATAFWYSSRTPILPFMFIFNPAAPDDRRDVVVAARARHRAPRPAMLLFAAGSQGWFITKSRWYESVLLLLVTFTLLRPGFWLDMVVPRYEMAPASAVRHGRRTRRRPDCGCASRAPPSRARSVKKTVLLPLGADGSGAQRIARAGLPVMKTPAGTQVMAVALNSAADKAGFEQGFTITGIEVERDASAKEWLFMPALLILGAVAWLQRRRASRLRRRRWQSPEAAAAGVARTALGPRRDQHRIRAAEGERVRHRVAQPGRRRAPRR